MYQIRVTLFLIASLTAFTANAAKVKVTKLDDRSLEICSTDRSDISSCLDGSLRALKDYFERVDDKSHRMVSCIIVRLLDRVPEDQKAMDAYCLLTSKTDL